MCRKWRASLRRDGGRREVGERPPEDAPEAKTRSPFDVIVLDKTDLVFPTRILPEGRRSPNSRYHALRKAATALQAPHRTLQVALS